MSEDKPFWAKCASCAHCWICAYLPMRMSLMSKLLKGLHCPNCGTDSKKITPAKQNNGVLQEEA